MAGKTVQLRPALCKRKLNSPGGGGLWGGWSGRGLLGTDRDLLGDLRWCSPLASRSSFKSTRSASSRAILERIHVRRLLKSMQQIWAICREVMTNGHPEPGISATAHCFFHPVCSSGIAPCSHLRNIYPTLCQMFPSLLFQHLLTVPADAQTACIWFLGYCSPRYIESFSQADFSDLASFKLRHSSHGKVSHDQFPILPSWRPQLSLKIKQPSLLRTVFVSQKDLSESLPH